MKLPFPRCCRPALVLAVFATAAFAAGANTALQSEPRTPAWVKRHETFVAEMKQAPATSAKVLFLGDSITDFWRRDDPAKGGLAVWTKYFAPYGAVNLGISGDRTQHVLWRLENGEIDNLHPQAIVLMIGTNNTGMEPDKVTPRNTPAEAAAGVTAIVKRLRAKLPAAKLLLLAVFPRGEKPDNPQRLQVAEINALIAKLDDGKSIHFLDIGQKFLTADGTLTKEIMPDFLHPCEKGYEIWAEAIKEPLAALVK